MTYTQVIQQSRPRALKDFLWPGLLAGSVLAAYTPTVSGLIDGPWQTEQEGHGPLIIAGAIWLTWQAREKLKTADVSPAPILGWGVLLTGLALMFLARTQGVLTFEAL